MALTCIEAGVRWAVFFEVAHQAPVATRSFVLFSRKKSCGAEQFDLVTALAWPHRQGILKINEYSVSARSPYGHFG